jgi:hypothetical protein
LKRKIIAILLVLTIASSVGIWIIYSQINQAPDLTDKVRISNFEWRSGVDSAPGWEGIILRNLVNITIQNSGSNNISNLTLIVKAMENGNEVLHSEGFSKSIDVLPAGESLEISEYVYSYVSFRPEGAECISTLLQGNAVLDNRTNPITWD